MMSDKSSEITYDKFIEMVEKDQIKEVTLQSGVLTVVPKIQKSYYQNVSYKVNQMEDADALTKRLRERISYFIMNSRMLWENLFRP